MFFKIVKNQSGSILNVLLISGVIISGAFAIMMNGGEAQTKLIQKARLTSAITLTVAQLKVLLQNTQSYDCPNKDISQCRLASSFQQSFQAIADNNTKKLCPPPFKVVLYHLKTLLLIRIALIRSMPSYIIQDAWP